MNTINISQARENIFNLVKQTIQTHVPLTILSKHGNAVLIGEDDWKAIVETLQLSSDPIYRETLIKGKSIPLENCLPESDVIW